MLNSLAAKQDQALPGLRHQGMAPLGLEGPMHILNKPRALTVPIIPSLVLKPISLGLSQVRLHQRLLFLLQ